MTSLITWKKSLSEKHSIYYKKKKIYLNYQHHCLYFKSIIFWVYIDNKSILPFFLSLSRITDIQIICLKEKLDTSSSACVVTHYIDYLVNSLLLLLSLCLLLALFSLFLSLRFCSFSSS